MKGRMITISFLFFIFFQVVLANQIYVDNSNLSKEENEYFSKTLNDIDLFNVDKVEILKKIHVLSEKQKDLDLSQDYKIQLFKANITLAKILGDPEIKIKYIDEYIEKYAELDNKSYLLYQELCSLKQISSDDKTQSSCFKEASNLFSNALLLKRENTKYIGSYEFYYDSFNKILIDYFARNRGKTDELCLLNKKFSKEDLPDKEYYFNFIKGTFYAYKNEGVLTEDDFETLGCFRYFNNLELK